MTAIIAYPSDRFLSLAGVGAMLRGEEERMLEPVVFAQALESLLVRGVGPRLTPPIVQRLRELGVDLGKPFSAAYPLATWVAIQDCVSGALYPDVSAEEAMFQLGADFVRGLFQTPLGQALQETGRTLGAHRMMERMQRNFHSSSNYLGSSLADQPDGSLLLNVGVIPEMLPALQGQRSPSPHYLRGVLHATLEGIQERPPLVELVGGDPAKREACYRIYLQAPGR